MLKFPLILLGLVKSNPPNNNNHHPTNKQHNNNNNNNNNKKNNNNNNNNKLHTLPHPTNLREFLETVWEIGNTNNPHIEFGNGGAPSKNDNLQDRLKYLWLVIIDYAKTCTPEHEQQVIIAFRDTYFKKLLVAIEGLIENKYTPEAIKFGLSNAKGFLEFICDAKQAITSPTSSKPELMRKSSIFFIEDEED